MKKKLYYTVEHGIEDSEYLTGNKSIIVYEIQNNEPKELISFECGNDEDSKSEILDRLDSDLYPEIELIIL